MIFGEGTTIPLFFFPDIYLNTTCRTMIKVLLFGDLGKKVQALNPEGSSPAILEIIPGAMKHVSDLLANFGIDRAETSHIFVNGVYSGFNKNVRDGDRVGIFPSNMGLLYKWYFARVEDD